MIARERSRDQLSADIHLLGDILGQVIRQQAGIDVYDLEERIRALAKTRRSDGDPEIERYLTGLVNQLGVEDAQEVARAFSTYFALVNVAEETHRVSVLRERTRAVHPAPLKESIGDAIEQLWEQGVDEVAVQRLLDRLHVELVFTAHPTEAKRRSVLSKIRRIAVQLGRRAHGDLLPEEEEDLRRYLLAEITSFWLTQRTRTKKPEVTDEVRTGLHYFGETIFAVVPAVYQSMERALRKYYPNVRPPQRFLTYGSWIGGDRDGNPFVTAEITAESLRLHRGLAVEAHRRTAQMLNRSLSLAKDLLPPPESFSRPLAREALPAHIQFLADRYPDEPFRLRAALLAADLAEVSGGDMVARLKGDLVGDRPRLQTTADLLRPLVDMEEVLATLGADAVTYNTLQPFLVQARVFGLHTARLDLRQDSDAHTLVIDELCRRLGLHDAFGELSRAGRLEALNELLEQPIPDLAALTDLSPATQESVNLFRLLERAVALYGQDLFGPYIISMTHGPEDVLAVLLLARWSGLCLQPDRDEEWLAIAPLFETRADLASATDSMNTLFSHPAYSRHLAQWGNEQHIMIGYSDSNKDAGYLAANWELYQAQERLADCCRAAGVQLTLFHGRGGTIARGGGSLSEAILAQPAGSIGGSIRVTEQGEVINERYDNHAIARRHLEQVVHAVITASGPGYASRQAPQPEWRAALDDLSAISYRTYRRLVYETPALLTYWQQATPINEVNQLRIGSRPAKRRQSADPFAGLRAIPWGFSWMQSRHVLPGWYGVGEALEQYATTPERLAQLRTMYRQWRFFRLVIDNAQISLGKADMGIARMYSQLVEDEKVRDDMNDIIFSSYRRTVHWILQVTGQTALLDNDRTLQRGIARRNPYVDPLNFIQITLLRRHRAAADPESEAARQLLSTIFLTINGIAAGLKNTG